MRTTAAVVVTVASLAALACGCGSKKDGKQPPPELPPGSGDASAMVPLAQHVWADPPREPGPARATQFSLGSNFGCARMSDDTLRCWGDNGWHQLGVDPDTGTPGAVVTPPIGDVVEVAAGYAFTCARKRDHSVWCWGYDLYGELGAASGVTTHVPARIAGIGDAVTLEAGDRDACVIRTDSSLWCWGDNTYNQLGDGTTAKRAGPVKALVDHVAAVTLSGDACVVRDDASLWCWSGNHGPTPAAVAITDVVQAGAGGTTTCAVRRRGEVVCWGQNDTGQLGRGNPPPDDDPAQPAPVVGLTGATAVSAEYGHACAIAGGAVWCWGGGWANPGFAKTCLVMTHHTGGGGGSPAQWEYCPTATPVPGIEDAISLETQDHSGGCVLTRAGAIRCWDAKGVTAIAL